MYLTNNFRLREFTRSAVAESHGIDNSVKNNTTFHSILQLCEEILQPIRDDLGPVQILSGYRCEALNKMVGGAELSQHLRGEAADISVPGYPAGKLYEYIRDNYQFDQLIWETSKTGLSWVHISWCPILRQQSFLLVK